MNGTSPRGKALPPRPSQDLGYGGQGRNGGSAQNGYKGNENVDPRNYGSAMQNGRRGLPEPQGRTVLEGYRKDIMNGFEEKPRYNPVSTPPRRWGRKEWAHGTDRIGR